MWNKSNKGRVVVGALPKWSTKESIPIVVHQHHGHHHRTTQTSCSIQLISLTNSSLIWFTWTRASLRSKRMANSSRVNTSGYWVCTDKQCEHKFLGGILFATYFIKGSFQLMQLESSESGPTAAHFPSATHGQVIFIVEHFQLVRCSTNLVFVVLVHGITAIVRACITGWGSRLVGSCWCQWFFTKQLQIINELI